MDEQLRITELDKSPYAHPMPEHIQARQEVYDAMLQRKETEKQEELIKRWAIIMPIVWTDLTRSKKMGIFNFFIAKKELELEVRRLTSIIEIERKRLQAEFDILAEKKTQELVSHTKLQQLEMQANLYNESLQKLQTIHAQDISKPETRLAKEYYDKMTEALREVNLEGNVQAKFTQELSMRMLDKALEKPMPAHFIEERIVSEKK